MSQPISTVRTNKGPLVATALPAPTADAAYATGRVIGAGTLAAGAVLAPVLFDGSGTRFIHGMSVPDGPGFVVDFAGDYDVDVVVRAVTPPGDDPFGGYIRSYVGTTNAVGVFEDFSYSQDAGFHQTPYETLTGTWHALLSTSMGVVVPEVNGKIITFLSNFSSADITYAVELGCHWIVDTTVAEAGYWLGYADGTQVWLDASGEHIYFPNVTDTASTLRTDTDLGGPPYTGTFVSAGPPPFDPGDLEDGLPRSYRFQIHLELTLSANEPFLSAFADNLYDTVEFVTSQAYPAGPLTLDYVDVWNTTYSNFNVFLGASNPITINAGSFMKVTEL